MREFVLVARLGLGAFASLAVASAPLMVAVALEGEEHETMNGAMQKTDESASKITLKHGPIKGLGMDEGRVDAEHHSHVASRPAIRLCSSQSG